MNTQTFYQLALLGFVVGAAFALLTVAILAYLLILGSRIASFRKLLKNLPRLLVALRALADGLDGAAQAAELAGGAAQVTGQALLTAGTAVDVLRVPTGSLGTRNLWDLIKRPPLAPDVFVLTDGQIGMSPIFAAGTSPVTEAGRGVLSIGQSLGPTPPQAGTLSDQLHESSTALRSLAQFLESLL